jgi:DNA-binding IclR family transcriptional regulator
MPDNIKLAILTFISSNAEPGVPARLSYAPLAKTLQVSKAQLDTLLMELNKERYISQYAKKGVDGFNVVLVQKGEDAVKDEML